MKPYYQDKYVQIYLGDCREVLPQLTEKVDLPFTDPPYNVNIDYGQWNDKTTDEVYLAFCKEWITQLKRLSTQMLIYVPTKYILNYWNMLGNDYRQIILTWSPAGAIRYGFVNQFASLLTNAKPMIRTKDVWNNVQIRGMGYFFKENNYGHPGYTSEDITGKVIASFTNPNDLILDPFLGSGTTAFCAKKLNRRCIGIEISEKYAEIAARRCSQEVFEL